MFEDLHRERITGSLAMFDRMIFKGFFPGLCKAGRRPGVPVEAGGGAARFHRLCQGEH